MNRSNRTAALVTLGAIVAMAVVVAIGLAARNGGGTSIPGGGITPKSFTASVTMTITLGAYGKCESGGYGDIREGGQVEIVNQKHEVIATGSLTRSSLSTCEFRATVEDIPFGEKMYGAKLGNANRGVIWHSEDEARLGWSLTLGGN